MQVFQCFDALRIGALLILRNYLTADRRYDERVKNQEIIELKELLQNRGLYVARKKSLQLLIHV
jgi:hypothetical protein